MTGIPYQQGNAVDLQVTFEDGTTPYDPASVTFTVRDPDDSLTSYVYLVDGNVTRLAEGVYLCELGVPTDAGQYHYEAEGPADTGPTIPGEFLVIPSSVDVPAAPPGRVMGPCQTWISGEDLVALCGADAQADAQLLDAHRGRRLDARVRSLRAPVPRRLRTDRPPLRESRSAAAGPTTGAPASTPGGATASAPAGAGTASLWASAAASKARSAAASHCRASSSPGTPSPRSSK